MVITNLQMRKLRQRKKAESEFKLYFLDSEPSVFYLFIYFAEPHCFAGLPTLMNSFISSCFGLGVL